MNLDGLSLTILLPAFLAGLLVIATHVPLGQQVLSRGIVFIDLAIAQIAGLGVIAAHTFGWEDQTWATQLAAVSAALLGALLLTWSDRRWPKVQEALIGVLFVLAATASILLLANNPHGGEHLKDLLVGQILWVTLSDLLPVLVLYATVLMIWFIYGRRLGGRRLGGRRLGGRRLGGRRLGGRRLGHFGFYALFAVTVTASVQLIGVYLVFATLIIPALATRNYPAARRLWLGYGLGLGGYAVGLIASALYDLPSGAVIVWALALLAIVMAWRAPIAEMDHTAKSKYFAE